MWQKIKCYFGFHERVPYGEVRFYRKDPVGLSFEKSKPTYICKHCDVKMFNLRDENAINSKWSRF